MDVDPEQEQTHHARAPLYMLSRMLAARGGGTAPSFFLSFSCLSCALPATSRRQRALYDVPPIYTAVPTAAPSHRGHATCRSARRTLGRASLFLLGRRPSHPYSRSDLGLLWPWRRTYARARESSPQSQRRARAQGRRGGRTRGGRASRESREREEEDSERTQGSYPSTSEGVRRARGRQTRKRTLLEKVSRGGRTRCV